MYKRQAQEVLGRLITPMIGMKWAPFELEGMNAAWVRPERSYDRNHAILYCHGGGYTSGNLGYSRPLASKQMCIRDSSFHPRNQWLLPASGYHNALSLRRE